MAKNTGEIVIKINGDPKDYEKAIKSVDKNNKSLSESIGSMTKVAAAGFAAVAAGIGVALKAYAEQEAAVQKMNTALQQAGTYSKESSKGFQDFAAQLQQTSVYGDEVILTQAALARAFTKTDEQAKKLTLAATELAARTGMSLDSAVKNLGKSLGGMTGELGETIPELKSLGVEALKSGAALDFVLDKFGGSAAAEVDTVAGSFKQAKNAFGDLLESVGALFAPVAKDFAKSFKKMSEVVIEFTSKTQTLGTYFTAIFDGLTVYVAQWAKGFGEIVGGVMSANFERVKKGMNNMLEASSSGMEEFHRSMAQQTQEANDRQDAIERERSAKNQENQSELHALEMERRRAEFDALFEQNEEFHAMSKEQQDQFFQENKDKVGLTSQEIQKAHSDRALAGLKEEKKFQDQWLKDQKAFGIAYAAINAAMHSAVFQGSKQAFGELAQLQASSSRELKAIGKAAAVANIVIKTAESAMNIFNGFSSIPIVGIGLGIAGAAAAVAFGAEQIGQVTRAQHGALVTGGIPGVDSVPIMAQRGELVNPRQNFEEVIGSVRAAREAKRLAERAGEPTFDGGQGGVSGNVQVTIGFDGPEASQVLTARQIEDRALGISQEG